MSVISTDHSQVEHWLIGEISKSADAEPPPLPLDGTPAQHSIRSLEIQSDPRSSVLKERPSVVPGGAPSYLVEQTAPCAPDP
jgi:hypothetical protein